MCLQMEISASPPEKHDQITELQKRSALLFITRVQFEKHRKDGVCFEPLGFKYFFCPHIGSNGNTCYSLK